MASLVTGKRKLEDEEHGCSPENKHCSRDYAPNKLQDDQIRNDAENDLEKETKGKEINDLKGKDKVADDIEGDSQNEEKSDSKNTEEEDKEAELLEKQKREQNARAQALTLEMVGDLPYAEIAPPENILFVCKLNRITQDEDLELIFSRFGKIRSCNIIRDRKTGDSLQYAFIEFDEKKSCEQAYFKMHGVLIDDSRIHVDFSQSVPKLSRVWRKSRSRR